MESKRTQAERSVATRTALVAAARPLFAARGFAGVGTDEIARAAGVTRGALYHQFEGKEELFAAVFEQVETELTDAIGAVVGDVAGDPLTALHAGIDAWLAACRQPEVHRIVLIEAPAALGYARWREIGARYGVGLVEAALAGLVEAGLLPDQPLPPLAHVLVGALDEGALYVAGAEDPAAAVEEVRRVLRALVDGLVVR